MKKSMKKLFFAIAILGSLLFAMTSTASAATGTCGDNVTWSFDESTGALAITGTGAMWDYTYTPMFNTNPAPWFVYATDIKTVTISEGITHIGGGALNLCPNHTSVILPSTTTSIGDGAFYGNFALTSITVPSGVTEIGTGVFAYSSALTTVSLPEGIVKIGGHAFEGCKALTNINIPTTVTTICGNALAGCPIGSLHISSNVSLIENFQFSVNQLTVAEDNQWYCQVDSVIYTKDMKTLCKYPSGVTSTTFDIPYGVTAIGEIAFTNGTNLVSVNIPNTVVSIGESAFYNCQLLTSITIPNSVEIIGKSAFSECRGLTTANIGSGVKTIGKYAFDFCGNLSNVNLSEGLVEIKGYAFEYCTAITSITIPNTVTTIGDGAFLECTGLETIKLSDNLTEIAWQVFNNCTSLTSITIPASVKEIKDEAFRFCYSLKSIVLGDGVEKIWAGAFNIEKTVYETYGSFEKTIYTSSLTDIYYTGTESQWNSVVVEAGLNDNFFAATMHYNSDTPKVVVPSIDVVANNFTVFVDGEEMSFEAYNIKNNNYVKLRDVAMAITGTEKEFEVSWDASLGAVSMTSNQSYTVVGGEMAKGTGETKKASVTDCNLYLDGESIEMDVYLIDGSNYFKLRDLGEVFDFNVSWDSGLNAVTVISGESYSADN